MWQGYISFRLNITLTSAQISLVQRALRAISTDIDSIWNDRILAIRPNLANNEIIVKAYWPGGQPTKQSIVNAISNALGISAAIVNSFLTITVFGTTQGDIYGGELAVNAYILNNNAAWNKPI